MAAALLFNGVTFQPVSVMQSAVVPFPAEDVWAVVSKWSQQALWMGTVEGKQIFSQLLGGETTDYVGAVRVFGIGGSLIFEQLSKLDPTSMTLGWHCITHPQNQNPFPASFLNFKSKLQLRPVKIPYNRNTYIEWNMELLTEDHSTQLMADSMMSIMEVGLLNLQTYIAAGAHRYGPLVGSAVAPTSLSIPSMPQPVHRPNMAAGMAFAGMQQAPPTLLAGSPVVAGGVGQGTAGGTVSLTSSAGSGLDTLLRSNPAWVPAPVSQVSQAPLSADIVRKSDEAALLRLHVAGQQTPGQPAASSPHL